MDGIGSLFAGFAAFWAALGIYVVTLGWRQSSLRKQLDRLEREIERQATSSNWSA
jgi:CcmD family protein